MFTNVYSSASLNLRYCQVLQWPQTAINVTGNNMAMNGYRPVSSTVMQSLADYNSVIENRNEVAH